MTTVKAHNWGAAYAGTLNTMMMAAFPTTTSTTLTTNIWSSMNSGTSSYPSPIYQAYAQHQQALAQNQMMLAAQRLGLQRGPQVSIDDIGPPPRWHIMQDGVYRAGSARFTIRLRDGTRVRVRDGAIKVIDANAKITYRANRDRAFNRFLNASELLQAFIRDLGIRGARQQDALAVPIELFINWLILRAADADGEAAAPRQLLTRCRWCGRFLGRLRATTGILFCNEPHAVRYMRREGLA